MWAIQPSDQSTKGKHQKGDYKGEIAHHMTADWLNSELKKRGY